MQATQVLLGQHETAHGMLAKALDGLTDEQLHHRAPGSTINSIAAVCAHALAVEDVVVHRLLKNEAAILESGYGERLGIGGPMADGLADFRLEDAALLREYAGKVSADTRSYLGTLSVDDLDRKVDTRFQGERPIGDVLSGTVIGHLLQHGGEVAALRGVLGLPGM